MTVHRTSTEKTLITYQGHGDYVSGTWIGADNGLFMVTRGQIWQKKDRDSNGLDGLGK